MRFIYSLPNKALISCLLLFSAQGQGYEYGRAEKKTKSEQEFQKILLRSRIDLNAPLGLGLLITRAKKSGKMLTCTLSMMSENLALINSHCVPKGPRDYPDIPCSEFIGAVVRRGESFEHRFCREIVTYSSNIKGALDRADYAVIRLGPAARNQQGGPVTSFEYSRKGFADGSRVVAHTLNIALTEDGRVFGKYLAKECQAKMNSVFAHFYRENSEVVQVFAYQKENVGEEDCHIVTGNSGSPVTDRWSSTVKGLVHGTGIDGSMDVIEKDLKRLAQIIARKGHYMSVDPLIQSSLVTNLACIPAEVEWPGQEAISPTCSREQDTNRYLWAKQNQIVGQKFQDIFEKKALQELEVYSPLFAFEIPAYLSEYLYFNQLIDRNAKKLPEVVFSLKAQIPHHEWTEDMKLRFKGREELDLRFSVSLNYHIDAYGILGQFNVALDRVND